MRYIYIYFHFFSFRFVFSPSSGYIRDAESKSLAAPRHGSRADLQIPPHAPKFQTSKYKSFRVVSRPPRCGGRGRSIAISRPQYTARKRRAQKVVGRGYVYARRSLVSLVMYTLLGTHNILYTVLYMCAV